MPSSPFQRLWKFILAGWISLAESNKLPKQMNGNQKWPSYCETYTKWIFTDVGKVMMAFILATDFDFIAHMSKMAFFWKLFSRQWRFWNMIFFPVSPHVHNKCTDMELSIFPVSRRWKQYTLFCTLLRPWPFSCSDSVGLSRKRAGWIGLSAHSKVHAYPFQLLTRSPPLAVTCSWNSLSRKIVKYGPSRRQWTRSGTVSKSALWTWPSLCTLLVLCW